MNTTTGINSMIAVGKSSAIVVANALRAAQTLVPSGKLNKFRVIQVGLHRGSRRVAIFRLTLHGAEDDFFDFRRNIRVLLPRRHWVAKIGERS